MRRHPDGTWETLEVAGTFTQSYDQLCDLLKTIRFDATASVSEFQGRLTALLAGPPTQRAADAARRLAAR